MTLRAMHSAASGMQANEFNLDTIANNLANAGTTGFKRTRANFEDLFYQYLKIPGAKDANSKLAPLGVGVGLGTRVAGTAIDFTQGSPRLTGNDLDVAIMGEGFFQVNDGAEILYTRAGAFSINAEGELVVASGSRGRVLEPAITIPAGTTNITISAAGIVLALTPPQTAPQEVGQIQTVTFINPQGLLQRGENLFSQTDSSGAPLQGQPGLEGRGDLQSGSLEMSNVEPVKELIELIKTQRNFELNSQVVQAADQLLQQIANLRRF
ncbi:MAG: flagellar basal-body rod protein FlgG [Planctomycetes bacterium]|nr:flagellar basal-body rod protein FlgG [Planctomycetota bacterium]